MSSTKIKICTEHTAVLGLYAADTRLHVADAGLHAADTGLHAADIFCIED
jgi:hypothetical protein